MKAIAYDYQAKRLLDVDLPFPAPGPHDLLVEIKAVSVNPVDNRARRPREAPPRVLGWDAAGVVKAVGAAVTGFAVGERVFYAGDIGRQGSFAEYQLVDASLVGHMRERMSFEQAAALPMAALTAWEALFNRMRVERGSGKRIQIIGAAGGVGSMAVQLAAWAGLHVTATASRPASAAWVRQLGAHEVVDHRAVLAEPVDYVLIVASTDDYLDVAARNLKTFGTIGTLVEATKPIDWAQLWDKSATLVWTMVFNTLGQDRILDQVARLDLLPIVTEVLAPLDARTIEGALETLAQGRSVGKTVVVA